MKSKKEKVVRVQLIKDGPIRLSNFKKIKFCGKDLDCEGEVDLCRCGETRKAPFCDNSHVKAKFSSKEGKDTDQTIKTWKGRAIETHFNTNLCMSAMYCQSLSILRKRELDGDVSAAKQIEKVVQACPSGALSYNYLDRDLPGVIEDIEAVRIIEGGEIRISQKFEGVELKKKQPRNRLALCRCGLSEKKPFCDGKHSKKIGFK